MAKWPVLLLLLATPAAAQRIDCNTAGHCELGGRPIHCNSGGCEVQQPSRTIQPVPAGPGLISMFLNMRAANQAKEEAQRQEEADRQAARQIFELIKAKRCGEALDAALAYGDVDAARIVRSVCPM